MIVLDEPTAGVDVELRQTLWQFVSQLNKQGSTVLLTTHYLEEAEALCGRLALLNRGEVVALDRTSAVAASVPRPTFCVSKPTMPCPPIWPRWRASPVVWCNCPPTMPWRSSAFLRRCARPGATVEDIEIRKADLEDVFLELIQGSNAARKVPGSRSMNGWQMLFYKEILRFWKVGFQTVAAPVITAILYMMIFGHVLEGRVQVYDSVSYTAFLLPGLVMMSVLQNAFANSSSSLIQSKVMGNLVFLQLTPLSHRAWFVAYVGSSVVRGMAVGAGVMLVTWWFARPPFAAPLWILVFGFMGAALLGGLGLIAGLWAEKFDQMAAFQNFVIMPMTFLVGRVLLDPFVA